MPPPARKQDQADPASPPLEGGRLVLAAIYAFVLPLVLLIASVVLLGGRVGELPALAVGLAAATITALAARFAARRRRNKREPTVPCGDKT